MDFFGQLCKMLYGIIDLGYVAPEAALKKGVALLAGGVSYLQLRAKGYDVGDLLEIARDLAEICGEAKIPFIVNDHLQLALDCGADGLHLGQDDGDLASARAALPENAILGRSTHSPEQARAALAEGADYIGFGPLFPTPTKKGRPAIGLDDVAEVMKQVGSKIPVFCIGGIKPDNLATVMAAGAKNVVVVSALLQAGDVEKEARAIVKRLQDKENSGAENHH